MLHLCVCVCVSWPMAKTPLCAHMFWSTAATGSPDITMPDYAVQGVTSAMSAFPGGVYLAHYGRITNAPDGVCCVDARQFLAEDVKDGLLARGMAIAHIADIVRFLAAADRGGWVVDADTLWLRPAPAGLHFATLWSQKKAQRANADTPDKRGTPFTVPANSGFAQDLKKLAQEKVEKGMQMEPTDATDNKCEGKDWATNIQDTGPLIEKHGYQDYRRPGIWFAPVPFWAMCKMRNIALKNGFGDLDEKRREKLGVLLPSTSEILQESYCVPTSFVFNERNPQHTGKGFDLRATFATPEHNRSILAAVFRKSLEFQGRLPQLEQDRDNRPAVLKKPAKRSSAASPHRPLAVDRKRRTKHPGVRVEEDLL